MKDIFVDMEGQKLGPFSIKYLRQKVSDGTFQKSDLVWSSRLRRWIPISEFLMEDFVKPHLILIETKKVRIIFCLCLLITGLWIIFPGFFITRFLSVPSMSCIGFVLFLYGFNKFNSLNSLLHNLFSRKDVFFANFKSLLFGIVCGAASFPLWRYIFHYKVFIFIEKFYTLLIVLLVVDVILISHVFFLNKKIQEML